MDEQSFKAKKVAFVGERSNYVTKAKCQRGRKFVQR